jgi:hypothetical protein
MDEVNNPLVVNGESGNPELERMVLGVLGTAYQLWQSRQRKYGVTNIARTGAGGCYVRLEDKVARLHEYYIRGQKEQFGDEGIEDTWLDAINYPVMGLLAHRGLWPSER